MCCFLYYFCLDFEIDASFTSFCLIFDFKCHAVGKKFSYANLLSKERLLTLVFIHSSYHLSLPVLFFFISLFLPSFFVEFCSFFYHLFFLNHLIVVGCTLIGTSQNSQMLQSVLSQVSDHFNRLDAIFKKFEIILVDNKLMSLLPCCCCCCCCCCH